MAAPGLAQRFVDALAAHGYDFYCGVPCSLLKGVIRILETEPRYAYVSAVREDSALGLAAGAWLGGRKPVVLMQNSGLGVCLNALVSLHQIYYLPALLVVSWRGEGGKDAPEHLVMGLIQSDLLRLLDVPYAVLESGRLDEQVKELSAVMASTGRPVALVVGKGLLE
jgi:phosphonopyruvate decarboxylase